MEINRFNIRVYGILLREGKVLLARERMGKYHFTKFPGGGLEYGEGIKDCLHREFREELDLEIETVSHFYTTDFFQQSAFRKNDQVISVYYLVKPLNQDIVISLEERNISPRGEDHFSSFFWVDLNDLSEGSVTFPIDQLVCDMLRENFKVLTK
jgi:8-oxo-dGTP diphosphatase